MNSCSKLLCDKGIHSGSDYRKALLRKKKEINRADFENDPEYMELTRCNQYYDDEFPTEDQCSSNTPAVSNASILEIFDKSQKSHYSPPVWVPPPGWHHSPYDSPVKPWEQGYKAKKTRCKKGTKKNKKTGLCESTKKASTSATASALDMAIQMEKERLIDLAQVRAKVIKKGKTTSKVNNLDMAIEMEKERLMQLAQARANVIKSKTPAKRCPTGTRRNKKTGICEPK